MLRLVIFSVIGCWLGAALACLGTGNVLDIKFEVIAKAYFLGGSIGCLTAAALNYYYSQRIDEDPRVFVAR